MKKLLHRLEMSLTWAIFATSGTLVIYLLRWTPNSDFQGDGKVILSVGALAFVLSFAEPDGKTKAAIEISSVTVDETGRVTVRDQKGNICGRLSAPPGTELVGFTANSFTIRRGSFHQMCDYRGRLVKTLGG